ATTPAPFGWPAGARRVGTAEAVAVPALLGGSALVHFAVPPPDEARWRGGVLFDDWVRRGIVGGTREARQRARAGSDGLLYLSYALPLSDLGVAWLGRGSGDASWQMAVVDAEAYSLTLLLVTATKNLVARERPYARRCAAGAGSEFPCGEPDQNRSFMSGHSAFSATGAGLVCAHHLHLGLYGSRAWDGVTCGTAVAAALATGALRVVADRHYASDVAVGQLVGLGSGYLLPTLVYHRGGRGSPPPAERGVSASILPSLGPSSAALTATGTF
ncbi:MAG: phosphatase PAP2 family protein, partial [Deltaproteobacteria bacterium]|nr:phosphatase PAP2 family protein [Deltaproteobacteria bacterium]